MLSNRRTQRKRRRKQGRRRLWRRGREERRRRGGGGRSMVKGSWGGWRKWMFGVGRRRKRMEIVGLGWRRGLLGLSAVVVRWGRSGKYFCFVVCLCRRIEDPVLEQLIVVYRRLLPRCQGQLADRSHPALLRWHHSTQWQPLVPPHPRRR